MAIFSQKLTVKKDPHSAGTEADILAQTNPEYLFRFEINATDQPLTSKSIVFLTVFVEMLSLIVMDNV
jgi:hypothetical protein